MPGRDRGLGSDRQHTSGERRPEVRFGDGRDVDLAHPVGKSDADRRPQPGKGDVQRECQVAGLPVVDRDLGAGAAGPAGVGQGDPVGFGGAGQPLDEAQRRDRPGGDTGGRGDRAVLDVALRADQRTAGWSRSSPDKAARREVARRPSSSPASASTWAPTHTPSTWLPCAACSLIQAATAPPAHLPGPSHPVRRSRPGAW